MQVTIRMLVVSIEQRQKSVEVDNDNTVGDLKAALAVEGDMTGAAVDVFSSKVQGRNWLSLSSEDVRALVVRLRDLKADISSPSLQIDYYQVNGADETSSSRSQASPAAPTPFMAEVMAVNNQSYVRAR